ncbi:MAG: hypothetical protein HY879_04995 [Deltaproteobacteria bacterium]|nr:hypothetical protein [Deltaproteobacteria bacterium]
MDTIVQAYKVAERVSLPCMIMLEVFLSPIRWTSWRSSIRNWSIGFSPLRSSSPCITGRKDRPSYPEGFEERSMQ